MFIIQYVCFTGNWIESHRPGFCWIKEKQICCAACQFEVSVNLKGQVKHAQVWSRLVHQAVRLNSICEILRLCLVSEMAFTGRAAFFDAAPSDAQKIILKIDLEDSWKSVRAWDSSADSKVAYEFENVKNMVLFVTHLYRDDKLRSIGLAQTCSYLVAWRRHVEDDVAFVDEPWKSCFRRDLQQETMQEKLTSLCDSYRYSVPRTIVSVPYFGFEIWLETIILGISSLWVSRTFWPRSLFVSDQPRDKKMFAILWTFTVHMSKCKISMPYQCETNSFQVACYYNIDIKYIYI